MTITVVSLDGIGGQGGPNAMCANLWRPLVESGRYENIDVQYAASIGPANPQHNPFNQVWLRESSIDGAHKAADAIRATPNIAAVIGYSGGADAASQLAEDMARGADYTRGLEVAWIVTIANPRRRLEPHRPDWGFGVAGEHEDFPANVTHFEVANKDDGIPCCPRYSPLRTLTDLGQDPSPQALLDRALWNAFQAVIPPVPEQFRNPLFWFFSDASEQAKIYHWLVAEARATREGWLSAAALLRGYLGTAHGQDYITRDLFGPVVEQILARRWHRKIPFTCQQTPAQGSGGYDHWHCTLPRKHKGAHRFRNYTWAEGGNVACVGADEYPEAAL